MFAAAVVTNSEHDSIFSPSGGFSHCIQPTILSQGFGAQFTTGKYVLGLLGALCAYSIVITALEWFRRRHFNFFYVRRVCWR